MPADQVTFYRGLAASIPENHISGRLLFTEDTGELFLDTSRDSRIQITDIESFTTGTIPKFTEDGKLISSEYILEQSVTSDAKLTDTWIPMQGATSTSAGVAGYVPAPSAGAATRYLRSDGTWQVPPNTTYGEATEDSAGLMSAADKEKLNNIQAGAQVNTVTGVKGSAEATYRTGNINITKDNIGLGNVDNTSDASKTVARANTLTTARNFSISGGATASAVAFNGNQDVVLNVTSIDATMVTGVLPLESIPKGAQERVIPVENDTARYALTANEVQLGDVVLVEDTGIMYYVVNTDSLFNDAGYQVFTAGAASSVPWDGVTGKPETYPPSTHVHNYAGSDSAGGPANVLKNSLTLQLNGTSQGAWNADTNKTINITYENVGAAAASHTHPANQITGLTANRAMVSDASGHPTTSAITTTELGYLDGVTSNIQTQLTNLSSGKSDIGHTHNYAGSDSVGGPANSLKNALTIQLNGASQGAWSATENKTINITPASIGAAPAMGDGTLTNLAQNITLGSGNAGSINQNGGTYQQRFDILDNSDAGDAVFRFSQSSNSGTSYDTLMEIWDDGSVHADSFVGDVTGDVNGNATTATTADKTAHSLTISLNGTSQGAWNGNADKTINITPSSIGASASNHTHLYAGSASAGGPANSAVRLQTGRTIQVALGTTTAATFDGTANIAPGVTGILGIAHGGTGATTADDARTNLGAAATSHTHQNTDITGFAASRVLVSNTSGQPVVSAITTTELGYLDGVTSNVQTQLTNLSNTKQNNITGAASTITTSNLTTNRALISDGSGKVAVSAITSTELGYLDNVTSNIQTQLNTKYDANSIIDCGTWS